MNCECERSVKSLPNSQFTAKAAILELFPCAGFAYIMVIIYDQVRKHSVAIFPDSMTKNTSFPITAGANICNKAKI